MEAEERKTHEISTQWTYMGKPSRRKIYLSCLPLTAFGISSQSMVANFHLDNEL